ncbi:hypothetical protein B0J11DRAFT_234240 [Dendryphion nanum]|uniref:Uncharacterized protein n=1 Tax=Dendryphion nanum TaxID=256645 RepID=A0A9P9CZS9_9PLEO|nr:hypothetical protein B0J11DRAFT_234240 [Dendryphion nanum]
MASPLPQCVDTVIIGNGPSALILSYILHGHIPYYVRGHHDTILDTKLTKRPCLLDISPDLYAHFQSSLWYSTQALPINTLLDTLLRPNADTEINPTSCIEWRFEPDKAIPHVAIGQASQAGGQWAENPVSASADIGTLSYAEQLSLPGYTYSDHVARERKQEQDQCDFVRPSRAEVADYLKTYPKAVGISNSIYTATKVDDVYRTPEGFAIGSLGLQCKHLVLASGIFTIRIPPPPLLSPIADFNNTEEPLLVIGSGFTAADIIISTPRNRKIIHIFQWAPQTRPSPLHGCHHSAYPEYATVYRQMKLSAISSSKTISARSPLLRRKSNPFFAKREWTSTYEGLPNAEIVSVTSDLANASATISIRTSDGDILTRTVGGLDYVIGRRGSLDFLKPSLRAEVLGVTTTPSIISSRTLRAKAEISLEVARDVFITGSLTGDSLIRHAVGGCVFAAGRILGAITPSIETSSSSSPFLLARPCSPTSEESSSSSNTSDSGESSTEISNASSRGDQSLPTAVLTNGHMWL